MNINENAFNRAPYINSIALAIDPVLVARAVAAFAIMGRTSSKILPAHAPVVLGDPDAFKLGRELHYQVPPERWCVTKEGMLYFEQEVRRAWKAGEILNDTSYPYACHVDPAIGPTMYAVNDYVIKPLTARYGGMSFALMLHPEGLECDIFATHA